MTILIYDVHASESGALAILNDLYRQICEYPDKSIKWIFAVSTPQYAMMENIKVIRFPWVKKSWGHRLLFNNIDTRKILKEYKPDRVFSLQNEGINYFNGYQIVYLHLPFILTDYRFDIKRDGKRLWLYQNVLSKKIFASLRKVDKTIVQTQWMRDALSEKGKVDIARIEVVAPDITTNQIGSYLNTSENRKRFFYPATSFSYKNHITILKACKWLNNTGYKDYIVQFTIRPDENDYTQTLYNYVKENDLNVVFGDSIPREKVFEFYTKSVLLFPSFVESFGLPLLEARLSNTFIIASNCSFSTEILSGYPNAMFFDKEDDKTLSEYMSSIISGKQPYFIEDKISITYKSRSLIDYILS